MGFHFPKQLKVKYASSYNETHSVHEEMYMTYCF